MIQKGLVGPNGELLLLIVVFVQFVNPLNGSWLKGQASKRELSQWPVNDRPCLVVSVACGLQLKYIYIDQNRPTGTPNYLFFLLFFCRNQPKNVSTFFWYGEHLHIFLFLKIMDNLNTLEVFMATKSCPNNVDIPSELSVELFDCYLSQGPVIFPRVWDDWQLCGIILHN